MLRRAWDRLVGTVGMVGMDLAVLRPACARDRLIGTVGMVGMFGCAAPCAWDRLIGTVGMVLLCSIMCGTWMGMVLVTRCAT